MGSLVIDWGTGFATGMGYNSATGKLCGGIRTVDVSKDPIRPSSTVSPSSQSSLVESEDSFAKAMNFSATFSTGYCGIGMSASASFMMKMDMNRKTSAVVKYIHWRDDHPTLVYTSHDTQLSDAAKLVLERDGPNEFYKQYGDCFIGGFYKGGECFAGYRMEFGSVEERVAAKASVEASYTATKGSASFAADLESRKVSCIRQLYWESVGYPAGSLPFTNGGWKEAVEFLDHINTYYGDKVQAVLARYENLDDYAKSLKVYKQKHLDAPSFIVPQTAFPGTGMVKDFNNLYAQLSYVRSQLGQMVKIGLTYYNPGDIQRQKCLDKINAFQDNILKNLSPGDLVEAEKTNNDSTSRLRELQKEGERLWKAGQTALNNFDGTVIELWNVTAHPYTPKRGDTRVSLEGFNKGTGLVLYSEDGTAPGPPPTGFGADTDLASKFKVWTADNNYFTLQALGVRSDNPIFIGAGEKWTEPFKPTGVRMIQFAARYEKADIMQDGGVNPDLWFRWTGHQAGNGMVRLSFGMRANPYEHDLEKDSLCVRVAPAAGDWKPSGNELTPYWLVGLSAKREPRAPNDGGWFRDANTQWQIRVLDDPVDARRRRR